MQINYEVSGGYANLHLIYRANTDNLPLDLAEELRGLVESSGVFDIDPDDLTSPAGGPPDVLSYRLSVLDGQRRAALAFTDVTAPPRLRPLLTRLQQLAVAQRRR